MRSFTKALDEAFENFDKTYSREEYMEKKQKLPRHLGRVTRIAYSRYGGLVYL